MEANKRKKLVILLSAIVVLVIAVVVGIFFIASANRNPYKISKTSVQLDLFDTQKITVKDSEGNEVNAHWASDNSCVEVAECANAGYEDALEVYRICGEMLGRGLSILIDVLNPERIVLGSVYQRSGHLLKESMEKVLERECLASARQVCEVVPAKLEENIGDYAALAVGLMGESRDVV